MATVKKFFFNLGTAIPYTLEGGSWAGSAGNAATGLTIVTAANSGQADDPGNALQTSTTGRNKGSANYWEWTGTWEDLGVPAGSTISDVNCDYDWKCQTYTTGATASTATGPMELRDGAGSLVGVFSTVLGFTSASAWATRTGTAISGLSDASSNTIKLRLNNDTSTGGSNTASVMARHDYVVVTITYSAGASPVSGSGGAAFAVPSLSSSGTEAFSGSGGVGFAVSTASGSGSVAAAGTSGSGGVAFTAPALSGSGTNTPPAISGTGGEAFARSAISGSGSVGVAGIAGSGGVSFSKPSEAASGAETFLGSGGIALTHPTLGGNGVETFLGSGGIVIAHPTVSGSSTEGFTASGGVVFSVPSLAGSDTVAPVSGTGSLSLAGPSLAGDGTLTNLGISASDVEIPTRIRVPHPGGKTLVTSGHRSRVQVEKSIATVQILDSQVKVQVT